MIFRGLPEDLHCGFVHLEPIDDGGFLECSACLFVSVKSIQLACGHSFCEECFLKDEESSSEVSGKCIVCDRVLKGRTVEIDRSALVKLRLKCGCGFEGDLKSQKEHRSSCNARQNTSISRMSSPSDISLSFNECADQVKQMIAKELRHVESDIVNNAHEAKMELNRLTQELRERVSLIESRNLVNLDFRDRFLALEEMLRRDVPTNLTTRIGLLETRIGFLNGSHLQESDVNRRINWNAMFQKYIWFDLERLRSRHTYRSRISTEKQEITIGGCSLTLSLCIDYSNRDRKIDLVVKFVDTDSRPYRGFVRCFQFMLFSTSGKVITTVSRMFGRAVESSRPRTSERLFSETASFPLKTLDEILRARDSHYNGQVCIGACLKAGE